MTSSVEEGALRASRPAMTAVTIFAVVDGAGLEAKASVTGFLSITLVNRQGQVTKKTVITAMAFSFETGGGGLGIGDRQLKREGLLLEGVSGGWLEDF